MTSTTNKTTRTNFHAYFSYIVAFFGLCIFVLGVSMPQESPIVVLSPSRLVILQVDSFFVLLAPVVICLVTSIYCLKRRLEAQGSGTNPYGPTDAPLELVFTIGFLWTLFCAFCHLLFCGTTTSSLSYLHEIASIAWCFLLFYIALVVIPWSFPSLSPSILGCKLPSTNRPDKFRILAHAVLKYGTIKESFMLILVVFFGSINLIAMGIEDYLFPTTIRQFDASQLVFILGHPRSGTTNLHKSFTKHHKTRVSTYLDLFCPAGSLRWCTEVTLKPLLRALVTLYDSPHHKLSIDEEFEEHVWLLLLFGTHATIYIFPSIIQRPDFEEIYKSVMYADEVDMLFLKRILARRCKAILKQSDEKYIAKPVSLAMQIGLFQKYFPGAKYIICARDRQEAFLSQLRYSSQMVLGHDNDLENVTLKKLGRCIAMYYSQPTFAVVENCVANQETRRQHDMEVVQFSKWKTEPEQVLANLLKFLELEQQTVSDNSSCLRTTSIQVEETALSDLVSERTECHESRTYTRIPSYVQLALQ